MRPVTIPDSEVPENFGRVICTANADLDTIYPCEALLGTRVQNNGGTVAEIRVLVELSDEDLSNICQGSRKFWLVAQGLNLPPFGFSRFEREYEKVEN